MQISHLGGTAGEPPRPEQVGRRRRRIGPPDNEFPAGVGQTVLLARSDDAAVGITQIEAFSTGFRFTLAVRLRQAPPELARGGLSTLTGSLAHHGIEIPLEKRLLLGIEYPDGRRASTLHDARMRGPEPATDDDRLMLAGLGGSGGELSTDQRYWVTPLPPEGPVAVILAWPGFGMPESRTVVDGTAIRDAAARSQVLWPPQPPEEHRPPPPLPRPSAGWFAELPD